MTLRSRKHLTAWLGLVAMWLVVLAPLVSQLVLAAHRDDTTAALCSATQPATGSSHVAHGDSLSACGYCDLLANQPAMPSLPPSPLVLLMLVAIAAAPVLSMRHTPLGAFPSGRPRAPPAFS
ncbi:MAG TPA: DUF2946 domain-containing protein [Paraburkholderia sp.]|uniref:DUF2946 domain-containing protein n=1 Tax=Paraburkholderia sp. TaxID=1926495 RepID=UPI002CD20B45|nr:DUF2946 domain-containing protein [Paraburkholderia sp.]HTR08484.1 DUF2946 domain-containing protein [Paraburkholderia sp.]